MTPFFLSLPVPNSCSAQNCVVYSAGCVFSINRSVLKFTPYRKTASPEIYKRMIASHQLETIFQMHKKDFCSDV